MQLILGCTNKEVKDGVRATVNVWQLGIERKDAGDGPYPVLPLAYYDCHEERG